MKQTLEPAERLIVAADFKPLPGYHDDSIKWVRNQVLVFARKLKGTGVCLKMNSALRACGYDLITEIQGLGLSVFADLKLIDISETMSTDGVLLREANPDFITTMCFAGVTAMKALKAELPDTEVLGVTVLTSLDNADIQTMFNCSTKEAVVQLARLGEASGVDGLICAPTDIRSIQNAIKRKMTFNTPAIRPTWAIVPGDDQNPERIMTPAKAIQAGADRIVVGRPIVKAENPYDAVMRTIEEIASATE